MESLGVAIYSTLVCCGALSLVHFFSFRCIDRETMNNNSFYNRIQRLLKMVLGTLITHYEQFERLKKMLFES